MSAAMSTSREMAGRRGPTVVWRGPGSVGFLGWSHVVPPPSGKSDAGKKEPGRKEPGKEAARNGGAAEQPPAGGVGASFPRRVSTYQDFLGRYGGQAGKALKGAVRAHFEAGGGPCVVLVDSRPPDRSGGDGGSGRRSGIYALADRDDVGTIVLADPVSSGAREAVVAAAKSRPDLFFVIEEETADAAPGAPQDGDAARGGKGEMALGGICPLTFLRSNVAALRREPVAEASRGEALGALLGFLESTDFREEPAFQREQRALPRWLAPLDALRLQAWRRQAGLHRSLEMGTRWVVFELNHPLLWGRVERDITLFLQRLAQRGFLAPGALAFEVNCGPAGAPPGSDGQASGGVEPGVSIVVRATLASPYGEALRDFGAWKEGTSIRVQGV